MDIQHKDQLVEQAIKAAPAVAGTVWATWTLNEVVAVLTGIYVVLQAAYLARRWWKEEHPPKDKE